MSVVRLALVALAVMGLCIPQPAWAAIGGAEPTTVATDVTLQDGNLLHGQVVDPQGIPLAKVSVTLQNQGQVLGTTQTNELGYFTFDGVTSGVYQIATPEGFAAYRVWTAQTAPPSSQPGALVVVGDGTVRGNMGDKLASFITNPWVVLAVVTTAIAVPVALNSSDNPSSP